MTGSLAGIDLAIVLVYLVGIVGFGMWQGRRVKTAADFFLAARRCPFGPSACRSW